MNPDPLDHQVQIIPEANATAVIDSTDTSAALSDEVTNVISEIAKLDSEVEDEEPLKFAPVNELHAANGTLSNAYLETVQQLQDNQRISNTRQNYYGGGTTIIDSSQATAINGVDLGAICSYVYVRPVQILRTVQSPQSDTQSAYTLCFGQSALDTWKRYNNKQDGNPGAVFVTLGDFERYLIDKYDDPSSPLSHIDTYALHRQASYATWAEHTVYIHRDPKLNIYTSTGALLLDQVELAKKEPLEIHPGYCPTTRYRWEKKGPEKELPKGFVICKGNMLTYSMKKWDSKQKAIKNKFRRKYIKGLNKTEVSNFCWHLLNLFLEATERTDKLTGRKLSDIYRLQFTRYRRCEVDDIEAIYKLVKKAGLDSKLRDKKSPRYRVYRDYMVKIGRCLNIGDPTKIPNFLKKLYTTESKRLKITSKEIQNGCE